METFYSKFLVVIAALLPVYLIRLSIFGLPTTILEVLIWLTFLVGLLQPVIRRSWSQALHSFPKPIFLFSLFFFLSAVLSTAVSPHLHTSLGVLKGWIITPMLYGFMVYAATAGKKKNEIRKKIIQVLILSGLIMALLGLSQLGLQSRVHGVFDVPNSLALYLAPIIVLAIFSASTADPPTWRANSRFNRPAAAIMFAALLFTQSVAGVLSVLIVLSIGFLVIKKLRFHWSLGFGTWAFIAGALVISAIILWPKIEYLIQPSSSAHVRLQLWSISWDLVKEHPLLGVGLGTFEPAYQQKLQERLAAGEPALPEFVFRDPHNWVLSFWLNLGLLGLLSFVLLNVYVLIKAKNPALKLSLITVLLFGLVDTVYWKNDLAILHWLLLALLIGTAAGYHSRTAG